MAFKLILMAHLLAAMAGVGVVIFMSVLGPRVGQTADAPTVLRHAGPTAGVIGNSALAVLWITGAWMAFGYGLYQAGGAWFWIKITLVVVLTGLLIASARLRRQIAAGGDPAQTRRAMQRIAPPMLITAVVIVIFAVLAFG